MYCRRDRLQGPVVTLRTFRATDGQPDLEKQRRHLRWLLDRGIREGSGVVMGAGGAGEGAFMNDDEWKAIVRLTAEECRGRVPSMAGVFDLSTDQAIEKARFCEHVGIDFIQLSLPHYMPPTDDEVCHHFEAINDAADVGLLVYNNYWAMPSGFRLSHDLFDRLAALTNVEGACWYSPDITHFVAVTRAFAERVSFVSNCPPHALSLPIRLGMRCFFEPLGNVAPRLILHMWELWKEKRCDEYDEFVLKTFIDPSVQTPEYEAWSSVGEGPHARAVMEVLGLRMGPPYAPQQAVPSDVLEGYRLLFERAGMMQWVDWRE